MNIQKTHYFVLLFTALYITVNFYGCKEKSAAPHIPETEKIIFPILKDSTQDPRFGERALHFYELAKNAKKKNENGVSVYSDSIISNYDRLVNKDFKKYAPISDYIIEYSDRYSQKLYKELLEVKPPDPDIKRLNEIVDSIYFYYDRVEKKDMDFYTDIYEYINLIPVSIISWEKQAEIQKKYLFHYQIQKPDDALNSADAYGNLAFSLTMLGKYKESIDDALLPTLKLLKKYYATDTLSLENKEFVELGFLVTTSYLALNYKELGDLKNQLLYAKENESYLSNLTVASEYNFIRRDCYSKLLDMYGSIGNYERFETLLDAWETENNFEDPFSKMVFLKHKIKLHRIKNNFIEAKKTFNEARDFYYGLPNQDDGPLINAYRGGIANYATINDIEMKRIPLNKIIELHTESSNYIKDQSYYTYSNPANNYIVISEAYFQKKKMDSVIYFLNRASESIAHLDSFYVHSVITSYKCKYFAAIGEIESAKISADLALNQMQFPEVSKIASMDIENVKGIRNVSSLRNIMILAKSYKSIYEKTHKQLDLNTANNLFLLSATILNSIKSSAQFNGMEQEYLTKINNGILETFRPNNKKHKNQRDNFEILNYLEINQAIELSYKYGFSLLSRENPETNLLLKNQKELENEILALENKALGENSSNNNDVNYTNQLLYKKKLALEKTTESLKKMPNLSKLFSLSVIDRDKIMEKLKPNDVLVRYFFSDKHLYLFKISKNRVEFIKIAEKQKIEALFSSHYNDIRDGKQLPSKKLGDILLPPLYFDVNDISHLTVIAHLELNYIPFETFVLNDKYSIANFSISYYPSLRLMEYEILQNKKLKSIAGFAPTYTIDPANSRRSNDSLSSNLQNLLGAKREVQNVASLFSGDSYIGSEATKTNFLKNASEYSILHLAGHTFVSSDSSQTSQIVFSKENKINTLSLNEIYGLRLSSDLVVLSACDTGNGDIDNSEGVMSFARAFQYAGSDATVTSLWKVPDKETSFMMMAFYNYLHKGYTKDVSLQKAKLEYLSSMQDPQLKHPYYWAGFVLSGDTAPIQNGQSYWWIALGIGVFLILLFLFLKMKKRAYK